MRINEGRSSFCEVWRKKSRFWSQTVLGINSDSSVFMLNGLQHVIYLSELQFFFFIK